MKKILSVILAITLTLTLAQGFCVMAAEDVQTAYGTIPAEYANAVDYPIVVFSEYETFWYAGTKWTEAMNAALELSGKSAAANILVRSDISVNDAFDNLSLIQYPLVIDLGGNNVSLTGSYLASFDNRTANIVTVKNGSFTVTNNAVFYNIDYYSSDSANVKTFIFEDISFKYGTGATILDPIIKHSVYTAAPEILNETFTNCTFDYRENCPENAVVFGLGAENYEMITQNVTVNGCALLANDMSKIKIMKTSNSSSSIIFNKHNDEYITISALENSVGTALDSYSFPTSEGNKLATFDSNADGYDVYKLNDVVASPAEPVVTPYGTIPAEYADASVYPIVVFSEYETFWYAGAEWTEAMNAALELSGKSAAANILVRSDISANNEFNNLAYIQYPLVIDLGGNNVSLAGSYLASFDNRTANIVTVKNGSFTITNKPVFLNIDYYSSDSANVKTFIFEDITFKYGTGATILDPIIKHSVATAAPEILNETFTNCTFDYRENCPENAVVFGLGAENYEMITQNVTVNGCALLANDMSKIDVIKKNNNGSSIVFAQSNGEYMTLSVPENSSVCKDVFPLANEMRRYVLDSTNEGTSLYKLVGGIFMVTDGSSVSAYNIDRAVNLFVGAYSSDNTLIDVVMGGGSTDTTVYTADLDKTGCVEIRAFLWGDECTPLCLPLDVPLN